MGVERANNEDRKCNKCVIPNGALVKLVSGDDIKMHEVVSMFTCTMVGRFIGRLTGTEIMKEWLRTTWILMIHKAHFYILTQGMML